MPFNYKKTSDNFEFLSINFNKELEIYKDIIHNGNFPIKFTYGNGISTIG